MIATRVFCAVLSISVSSLQQAFADPGPWSLQDVKAHCENEWENDFSIQEYCVKQNKSGFDGYSELVSKNQDSDMVPSFAACESEWGIQWEMVEYCARQQISGKAEIPLALRDLPEDVADAIERKCRSEWGGDFSMIAYCADQNATSWRNLNN